MTETLLAASVKLDKQQQHKLGQKLTAVFCATEESIAMIPYQCWNAAVAYLDFIKVLREKRCVCPAYHQHMHQQQDRLSVLYAQQAPFLGTSIEKHRAMCARMEQALLRVVHDVSARHAKVERG
jgi:hypothetical protein